MLRCAGSCSDAIAHGEGEAIKSRARSLRFSDAEDAEIRSYVQLTGEQEAVMMERVAMRGLREERLDKGLLAHAGGVSSSEAAALAGIDRHSFLNKALDRGVIVLDDQPENLSRDLSQAAILLGDERLSAAIAKTSKRLTTEQT